MNQNIEWQLFDDKADSGIYSMSRSIDMCTDLPTDRVAVGPWEPFAAGNGCVYWRRPLAVAVPERAS